MQEWHKYSDVIKGRLLTNLMSQFDQLIGSSNETEQESHWLDSGHCVFVYVYNDQPDCIPFFDVQYELWTDYDDECIGVLYHTGTNTTSRGDLEKAMKDIVNLYLGEHGEISIS